MIKPIIYLIGSLRDSKVPEIGQQLRDAGFEVFDDWHAAGPTADDEWKRYEEDRGHTYEQALEGYAAKHVFAFDKHHLLKADIGVLIMPCGKSGHLELGYMLGLEGKRGYILREQGVDRWDCMYQFADGVFADLKSLIQELQLVYYD